MQVVVFSSQKGGSGKTTLCGQLAVQAELSGAGPVAIVDTDPQGSLAEWWNARQAEVPLFMKAQVDYLHEDLDQLERAGVHLVFVDTPPAVTDIIRKIVGFADLVVIPTRPSPHDLRAVGATLDIIESQQKPLVFTINAATPRAKITSDTAVALSQHGTVAPVKICQRTVYATSMIHGLSVMETDPESQAAQEIASLWEYLSSRLTKPDCRVTRGTGIFQQPRAAGFGRRKAPRSVAAVAG
jgi:chromosome partitioning protein